MLSYCFAWTPLVIVMTVSALSIPWLGLIALMVVSCVVLGLLAALAWTIVSIARVPSRAIRHRLHGRGAGRRAIAATSRENSDVRATRSMSAGAAALLANPPSERHS